MSKKQQRQDQLIQIIKTQGLLPVRTFSNILQVSEMTVRRDLEELECQMVESGESAAEMESSDHYSLMSALKKANTQKNRIGEFAASLIEQGDVIIVDTGSTTARMLSYIPANFNLTILCYNANVVAELRHKPGTRLLVCGGVYHPNTEMFESPEGIGLIERTRAHKMFISAAGIHETLGVTCANYHEILTKQTAIRSTQERILVADSSKFGQIRCAHFCGLEDLDCVVTDDDLPRSWRELLQEKDIRLYVV